MRVQGVENYIEPGVMIMYISTWDRMREINMDSACGGSIFSK